MKLDTEAGKRRFVAEAAAIEIYNRGKEAPFRITVRAQGAAIVLEVGLRPTRNLYKVRATLGDSYPARPPDVQVLEPADLPRGVPHLLGGGRPCLFNHHPHYGEERWDPARHTAVFALLATWRWCLGLDFWAGTGRWIADENR